MAITFVSAAQSTVSAETTATASISVEIGTNYIVGYAGCKRAPTGVTFVGTAMTASVTSSAEPTAVETTGMPQKAASIIDMFCDS